MNERTNERTNERHCQTRPVCSLNVLIDPVRRQSNWNTIRLCQVSTHKHASRDMQIENHWRWRVHQSDQCRKVDSFQFHFLLQFAQWQCMAINRWPTHRFKFIAIKYENNERRRRKRNKGTIIICPIDYRTKSSIGIVSYSLLPIVTIYLRKKKLSSMSCAKLI